MPRETGSERAEARAYDCSMISSIRLRFGSISLLALAGCAGPQPLAPLATAHAAAGESIAATVTFRVTVPTATPVGDTVFIAGSLQAWNPGSAPHALRRQSDGRWTITLDLTPGSPIQFKFTRGSWTRVEKGGSGEEIPDRERRAAAVDRGGHRERRRGGSLAGDPRQVDPRDRCAPPHSRWPQLPLAPTSAGWQVRHWAG